MTDYSANNKTVSNEIRKENKSTYQNNVVVVASSLFVRKTTQRILPNPPYSLHLLYPAVLPSELDPPFHSCFS